MKIEDIVTPALIVDYQRLLTNIKTMANKARKFNVSLRPHIKTHKCIEIGKLQKAHGSDCITVSTLGEARIFAKAGFKDMTLAFPLVTDKIPAALELAKNVSLKILMENSYMVEKIDSEARKAGVDLDVLVKVDCGYHRCGVDPLDRSSISLVKQIADSSSLRFTGILTHGGHAYSTSSIAEVIEVAQIEQNVMLQFAEKLRNESSDLDPEIISIGSTPTMMATESIQKGISEIRPGNYVFFDYTQVALGVCTPKDCAVSVLASVVGSYADHILTDAGATALSLDAGPTHLEPDCGYGKVITDYQAGTLSHKARISALSQEHGKIIIGSDATINQVKTGDKIRILPNHSCLTDYMFDRYYVADGNSISKIWKIHRDRLAS